MKSKAKFVLSKKKLLEQYSLASGLADEVSYSFKTNAEVGEILEQETNCSFSVHSHHLLQRIKDKSRVWFFSQAWDEEELDWLFSQNVSRFVVDNKTDLRVLLDYLDEKPKKISLLLRMRLKEHTVHTGKHFVFGMYSDEVNELIPILKENENISELGVHFHRKTQNISEWGLKGELQQALKEETIKILDYVNLGGGIPVNYKNSRARYEHIFEQIRLLREWLFDYGIKTIVEPGRLIAGPCIELHTTVKNIYRNNVIVDASVYNAAMDTFVAHVRMEVEGEFESGEAYTIKGCMPDSMDIFRYRVFLEKPEIGKTLVFKNAGAYNFSTEFCGLKKLPTEIVD